MSVLDKAQRKLLADFFEKFALAIATAVSAKVFFAEEGLTVMTYCAIAVAVVFFSLSMFFVHGTENKDADTDGERGRLIAAREDDGKESAKHGAVQEKPCGSEGVSPKAQRKRRNGKSVR